MFCEHYKELFTVVKGNKEITPADSEPDWYNWQICFNVESITRDLLGQVKLRKQSHSNVDLVVGKRYSSTERDLIDPGRNFDWIPSWDPDHNGWKDRLNSRNDKYREWDLVERVLTTDSTCRLDENVPPISEHNPPTFECKVIYSEESKVVVRLEDPEVYKARGSWQGFQSHLPSLPNGYFWVRDLSSLKGRPKWVVTSKCIPEMQVRLVNQCVRNHSKLDAELHSTVTALMQEYLKVSPMHLQDLRRKLEWWKHEESLGSFYAFVVEHEQIIRIDSSHFIHNRKHRSSHLTSNLQSFVMCDNFRLVHCCDPIS